MPKASFMTSPPVEMHRIDALLQLYDGALIHLERATEALRREGDQANVGYDLTRANLFIFGIQSGLDGNSAGELVQRVNQLSHFAGEAITGRDLEKLTAAITTLRTLRNAYSQVRSQALQMEAQGEIEPFRFNQLVDTSC